MTGKKHDKALHIDMPFGEALARFAQTDPREVDEPKKKKKQKASRFNSQTTESKKPQQGTPKPPPLSRP